MSPEPQTPSSERLAAWSALLEPSSGRLLARIAEIEDKVRPGPKELSALRELAEPAVVSAALDLAQARHKGADKFSRVESMILDLAGVEQASGEDIAQWKAQRFAGQDRVWDLCCGIGGDAMALAEVVGSLVAVDSDPLACLMARHNLGLSATAAQSAEVRCLGVEDLLSAGELEDAVLHIDPARRSEGSHSGRGGRSWRFEDGRPGPEVLARLVDISRGAAIKLGPGVELDELPGNAEAEIEVIGSRGGLKQVVLWTGALTERAGQRRATRVEKGQTFAAAPRGRLRHREAVSTYLYIPDPALERAGLVAARLAELDTEAWNLHPGLGYLHGEQPLDDPWFQCFEVATVLPWREKKIKAWLEQNEGGDVEVRTRGGAVVVEKARRELRGGGPKRYVIFGLRLGKRIQAFVTRVLDPGNETPG